MIPSPDVPHIPSDRPNDRVPATGIGLCLRTYHVRDRSDVHRLYHEGLLAGIPDPLDSTTDLDRIDDVYLKRPQDHFWVAEANGEVIGTIAILKDDNQIGHVRRLRVDPFWKLWRGGEIARVLIQKATDHAREYDCLKLVLHTPVNDDQAIAFLHQLGFEYSRARELRGRHLLEFYLNIYLRQNRPIAGNERFA
jgi:N-acetylglutamate synthase-like GNAT family acetyltransferase